MTLLRRAKAVETKLERAVSSAADGTSPRIKVAGTPFPDSPKSPHRCGLLRRVAGCSGERLISRACTCTDTLQAAAQHFKTRKIPQRAKNAARGGPAEVQVSMSYLQCFD